MEGREGLAALHIYITICQLLYITPSITPLTQATGARKYGYSCTSSFAKAVFHSLSAKLY
jgi:hypothetical protein